MPFRFGFRVASDPAVGAGHMMRCLALAERMAEPPLFVLDPGGNWTERLDGLGLQWREETRRNDGQAVLGAIAERTIEASLFDGYEISQNAIEYAARQGYCARIDDFATDRQAHTLLVPGFPGPGYDPHDKRIVSGAAYALLGSRYAETNRAGRSIPAGPVRQVLVSFGMRDSVNATALALDALEEAAIGAEVVVILGSDAPHLNRIRSQAAHLPKARVLCNVDDMVALYSRSDLAIGTGGVSMLERMCCGVPSILITQADNQKPNAEAAEACGAARYLGAMDNVSIAELAQTIATLCEDTSRRQRMRETGLATIDGNGAARSAAALETALKAHEHQLSV